MKGSTGHKCYVEITAKAIYHGDLKGMNVPCIIEFVAYCYFVEVSTKDLQKHKRKSFIENKYLTLPWNVISILPPV